MSTAQAQELLAGLGLPISQEMVDLADSVATYGWASHRPWGEEAAKWMNGLKICGSLYQHFSKPDLRHVFLINILTQETQAAICQYVKDNSRKSQAELSAEVQRRLEVYAAQVDLIKRGVVIYQPGGEPAGTQLGRSGGHGGGGGRTTVDFAPQPSSSKAKKKSAPEPATSQGSSLLGFLGGSKSSKQSAPTKPEPAPARKPEKVERPKSPEKPISRPSSSAPKPALSKTPSAASVKSSHSVPAATQPEEDSKPTTIPPGQQVEKVPVEEYQGTVYPADNFDPEEDAAALRKAMKGLGCDDKAVVAVLAYRSVAQRQEIARCFNEKFGKKLRKELDSELSGNVKSTVKGLMMDLDEHDAYLLYMAMKGMGTNEDIIVEILASRTNDALRRIRQRFTNDYSKDLLQQLKSETSGDFQKLVLRLAAAERETGDTVDVGLAQADAQALYEAGEGRRGTDEAVFIDLLSRRSFPQLRRMFDEYKQMFGKDFRKVVESEFSGDIKAGLLAVVKCARNVPAYFAECLHKSMKGLGTDDDMLVRIIVTRCEVDTVQIKERFQELYGKTLKSFIEGDTSGNYKRLLLSLLDER